MHCQTRDFGAMDFDGQEIFHFVQPPYGFETYKRFALIYDAQIGDHIVWLQSVEEPSVCFILFDPSSLAPYFAPRFPPDTLDLLGDGDWVCWVVGVVSGDGKRATVNLKSPILVNLRTRRGAQIILEQDYPVRFPLMREAE